LNASETQAKVTDDFNAPAGNSADDAVRFMAHWGRSGGAERANFPSFARDLCDLLAVPHPEPTLPEVAQNAYVFERDVTFQNLDGSTSLGRIDLYKRGCFVLEAKQGTEKQEADADDSLKLSSEPKKKTKRGTAIRGTKGWDDAMVKARGQAEQYARALPTDQGCAALLSDLRNRGLLEETLVVWGGEFGRTPTTEGNNGRDHSPYGFSMWLAGGGVRGGQAIGVTDDFGFRAVDDKLPVHGLHATILKLMGIDPERLAFHSAGLDQRLIGVETPHDLYDRLT
jgi:hypothetical protein